MTAVPQDALVFAEQDDILEHEAIARAFLADVLGLDLDACFISDDSELSDFTHQAPDDVAPATVASAAAWDAWILREVERRYAVTLTSTRIELTRLFHLIAAKATPAAATGRRPH